MVPEEVRQTGMQVQAAQAGLRMRTPLAAVVPEEEIQEALERREHRALVQVNPATAVVPVELILVDLAAQAEQAASPEQAVAAAADRTLAVRVAPVAQAVEAK